MHCYYSLLFLTLLLFLNKFAIVCECYYLNWQLLSYHHISSTFQTQTLHWPTLLCYAIPCSAFSLPCFGLLCCFALRFSFSGVPYAALLCPTLVYLLSSALLLCPALACPTLLYLTLPCYSWLWFVLICSAQLCPTPTPLPCSALPCLGLPCPTLLCFALHCSALPYHTPTVLLFFYVLCHALPGSALHGSALSGSVLRYSSALLCSVLLHIALVPNSPWRSISFHVSLWHW